MPLLDIFSLEQLPTIPYTQIQNVTADRVLGRLSTSGSIQELTAAQVRTLINVSDGANAYTLPTATSTVLGGVELFSDTVQTVAANAVTTTASRTYGIQLNSSGQMVVNVPWVDTNTTYSAATSTVLGLVELFSDTVQTVAANAVTTTASRTYGIQVNSSGQMVVNVPWVDTNTTYSAATSTTLGLVELFSDTVQTTAANAVTTTASRTYGIQVNSSGQMVVNIPWTDTVYTHPSYTAVSQTLSGATVLASFSSDTIGSVTGFTTRTLTTGDIGAAATNQTMYIGTTAVAINRASAALSLTGVSIDGTSSGVVRTVTGTNTAELVRGNMADNDQFRILVGGTASNAGYVEIATADDGTEPIHVRQYTGTFTTLTRTATLLDGSGNTSFPGTLTAASLVRSGGTSSQFLKADGSVDSNSYYLASNPNGYTSNTGTVTNIATGTGLTGGPITGTGTISHSDTSTLNGSYGYVTPDDTGLVVGGISVDGLGHVTDARIYNFRTYTDATYPTKTLQLTIGATTRDLSASRTWTLSDIGVASATGTGASGTWGINITGNAATATNISNTGTVTLATATESNAITVTQPSYTTGQPVKLLNFDWYGNIMSIGNIRSGSTPTLGLGVYYTPSGGSISEIARFNNLGNLLIGTTTDLGTRLYVAGAGAFTGNMNIGQGSGAGETALNIGQGKTVASPAYIDFQTQTGGSVDYDFRILKDAGANGSVALRNAAGSMQIINEASETILFGTANTGRMYVLGNGNVLINTVTDAGYSLRVNGIGLFDSGLRTGAPTGSSAQTWKLGAANFTSSGTPTHQVIVEIAGTVYKLLAVV